MFSRLLFITDLLRNYCNILHYGLKCHYTISLVTKIRKEQDQEDSYAYKKSLCSDSRTGTLHSNYSLWRFLFRRTDTASNKRNHISHYTGCCNRHYRN